MLTANEYRFATLTTNRQYTKRVYDQTNETCNGNRVKWNRHCRYSAGTQSAIRDAQNSITYYGIEKTSRKGRLSQYLQRHRGQRGRISRYSQLRTNDHCDQRSNHSAERPGCGKVKHRLKIFRWFLERSNCCCDTCYD